VDWIQLAHDGFGGGSPGEHGSEDSGFTQGGVLLHLPSEYQFVMNDTVRWSYLSNTGNWYLIEIKYIFR
jgi:hypothetical protein